MDAEMTQYMLDIETLGTEPGSVILSIALVRFNLEVGILGDRHVYLQPELQTKLGATIDPSTVMWWLGQSEQARQAIVEGNFTYGMHPVMALEHIFGFYIAGPLWANSPSFDCVLVEDLARRLGKKVPWSYRDTRDTRTLFDVLGKRMGDFGTPKGTAHDARVDATWQACEVRAALASLEMIKAR